MDNDGTPLHRVASEGRKDVVEALLAANADANALGTDGITALHHAVAS